MAAISWSDVTNHAPELASLAAGAQTDILDFVNTVLEVYWFCGEDSAKTKLARIYLAAHLGTGIAASGGSNAVGVVTAEAAGGLSRSYGQASTLDIASLGSTSYGQAFAMLVRSSAARVPFVP